MKYLFINLASHDQLFALTTEEKTIDVVRLSDHKDEKKLMPALEGLLKKAKWEYKDLTHIAAVTGPGGFMSLRVGVSMANALSWSLKIPLAGVHGSDVWWSRLGQRTEDLGLRAVWLHSTKKDQLFIRGFGELEKKWPEPILMKIDEAKALIPKDVTYVGELIPEHQQALGLEMAKVAPIEEVLPGVLEGLEYSETQLQPWYGREA